MQLIGHFNKQNFRVSFNALRSICLFAILLISLSVSRVAYADLNLSNYNLVFNDEFNGDSLDASKWATRYYWGPFTDINDEEQYYVDTLDYDSNASYDPFSFTGSSLIIRAVETTATLQASEQPPSDSNYWLNPDYQYNEDYSIDSRNYLSGIIASHNSFNFTHGYVEARAKLPAGKGLWSAFWLLNYKYVEDIPEIDIVENLGEFPNEVYHTAHYADTQNGWQINSTPTYKTTGQNFTAGFHTYGIAWEPTKITWFVDGRPVKTITDEEFLISKQSMYIIANLAVGGVWPGSPDSTTLFPAEYEIDYIRAYQRKPVPLITQQVLADEYQLMFSDEFDGSELDPQKWNTSYLWGPYYQINNEEQVYIDKLGRNADSAIQPFEVSNDTLKITAAPASQAELPSQPPLNDAEWLEYNTHQFNSDYQSGQIDSWDPGYSSGLITSYDAFKFVHGYVEARIKVPEGSGLWPAFWLLNGYYVGPQPEIDIMEIQGEAPNIVHHSYHYSDINGQLISSAETSTLPDSSESLADEFHTYGVQWDRGKITWYLDGAVTRVLEGPETSTQLMYILANLAVGGNFVGDVDAASIPAVLEIDYIRAYQRNNDVALAVEDTVAPTLVIESPTANAVLNDASFVVSGSAIDSSSTPIPRVQYMLRRLSDYQYIDPTGNTRGWGPHATDMELQPDGTMQWSQVVDLPEGKFRFYARAIDGYNNASQWTVIDFTIDNSDTTPPTVSFTNPASSNDILPPKPILSGLAEDNVEVAQVQYQLRRLTDFVFVDTSGTATNWSPTTINTADDWNISTTLNTGNFRLYVRAIDSTGIISTWDYTDFSIGGSDNTPPEISISSPQVNLSQLSPANIISGSVSDNTSIQSLQYQLRRLSDFVFIDENGTDGVWNPSFSPLTSTSPLNADWEIDTNLDSGQYRLYTRATDGSGNSTSWIYRDFSISGANSEPVVEFSVPSITGQSFTAPSVISGTVEGTNINSVQFMLRRLSDFNYVDTTGAVVPWGPTSATSVQETATGADWTIPTNLTAGLYRVYVRGFNTLTGDWFHTDFQID
jgi:beta-glucanase (GH16 family)